MSAEPKSNASVEWENSQSLSKEEKATVYAETKEANPGAAGEEFALAYQTAVLKAGVQKGRINLGGNLGEVWISLFSLEQMSKMMQERIQPHQSMGWKP